MKRLLLSTLALLLLGCSGQVVDVDESAAVKIQLDSFSRLEVHSFGEHLYEMHSDGRKWDTTLFTQIDRSDTCLSFDIDTAAVYQLHCSDSLFYAYSSGWTEYVNSASRHAILLVDSAKPTASLMVTSKTYEKDHGRTSYVLRESGLELKADSLTLVLHSSDSLVFEQLIDSNTPIISWQYFQHNTDIRRFQYRSSRAPFRIRAVLKR
jgi:hypothetical protein